MNHYLANETYAAERYLLGEMSGRERVLFEEHFFSCRICGQETYGALLFVENAKALFREEALRAGKRAWLTRERVAKMHLPLVSLGLAVVLLAAFVGYQNAVVTELMAARSAASPVILESEMREPDLPNTPAGKPQHFQMELPHPSESDSVELEVLDAEGKTMRSGLVDAPGGDEPLDVFLPTSLKPGRYLLVVRRGPGDHEGEELTRNAFRVSEAESLTARR